MEKKEEINEDPLFIERIEDNESIVLRFIGKSILRDPVEFMQPLLFRVLDETSSRDLRLVLDFRDLTYMNSSTFTPLIKTLEKARIGTGRITVRHDADEKWQSVSFAALTIFATADGRIAIEG